MVFRSHAQFHIDFQFFRYLGPEFFPNGFPNPFIVHSRPSFLFEPNLSFSPEVFVHMWHFDIDCFFILFYLSCFENGFSNSLIVRSRSSSCLVNENYLNCTSGLVLICLLFSRQDFCYDHMTSQLQICFLFIRSCNIN